MFIDGNNVEECEIGTLKKILKESNVQHTFFQHQVMNIIKKMIKEPGGSAGFFYSSAFYAFCFRIVDSLPIKYLLVNINSFPAGQAGEDGLYAEHTH